MKTFPPELIRQNMTEAQLLELIDFNTDQFVRCHFEQEIFH